MPETELQHVDANGVRFAYIEKGTGPLALLLHGFPDTPHGWDHVMQPLADAGYRVVAPFTRGYAPTSLPQERETTVEQLAEDALALIEALGHEDAVVVGHDWGAATAMTAAGMNPSRVRKLVAVGIPHPAEVKPSLKMAWGARHFVTLILPGALRRFERDDYAQVDDLYRRWSPTWRFDPKETEPVKRSFASPGSADAALGYYRAFKPGHIPRVLRKPIKVPTMMVAGLDDPILDADAYHRGRRRFESDFEVLELRGGHFVHRESPNEFRDGLVKFLGRAS